MIATQRLQLVLHSNPTFAPILILLISLGAFALLNGGNFFSALNISLILQQVSIIGILAAAQTLIILTAGIDLSIGAVMMLVAVIMGHLSIQFGLPTPLALVIGLVAGFFAGWFNGLLVTQFKLPPFIVTLGTWSVFLAITRLMTGSQSIRSQDIDEFAPILKFFGSSINFGFIEITYGSILLFVVFFFLWLALTKTAWGRHVYAVGDDKTAAELAGIRTDKHLRGVYAIAGVICAVAAWASIGRVGAISPNAFAEANLQSITAVVIGGVSLFGGRGSIFGPLFGALIVGVFEAGLRQAGLDVQWQVFTIGWLIILAVATDQWIRKISK